MGFFFFDDESKDNEPVYDDYTSQSENGEEGYVVLDTFECEVNCYNAAFLENTNQIISGGQEKILVDSQEGINTQVKEFPIDECP